MHIDYYLDISQIPEECIYDCSHSGGCDADVERWTEELKLTVDAPNARKCLKGYGIEPERVDEMTNETLAHYILWLACGDFRSHLEWIKENPGRDPQDAPCGSEIFTLEK